MNCRDVDHFLIEHEDSAGVRLPAKVHEHVLACDSCGDLVRALSPSVVAEGPSLEILRRLERSLAAELRPVRPLAPARYFFAAFAAIFVLIVTAGVYPLGAFAIAVMSPAQSIAMLGALSASAGLVVYSLVRQMAPGSRHWVPPKPLPVVVVAVLAIVMTGLFRFQYERDFWSSGWACLRAGTAFALLAAVPFWLILRRGAILSPRVTGATAGFLAGLVGTSALELHCTILGAAHILTWHLGVALLGALIGLAAGFAGEAAGRHLRSAPR
jgi:hypothetical protein